MCDSQWRPEAGGGGELGTRLWTAQQTRRLHQSDQAHPVGGKSLKDLEVQREMKL